MDSADSPPDSTYTFDFGGHVHPEAVAPEPVRELNVFVGGHHTDVDALARWYDEAGIDGAALSQPAYMGHGDAEATARANDVLLEEIDTLDQFFGLAAIPTAAGGVTAANEFERCLGQGYHGGAIETRSEGIELTDPAVEPILEVANQTGVPLLVHPTLDGSLGPDVLDDTYLLNAVFGREVALAESLCKVIHDGVLERYPDLTLVYHHFGGNLSTMLGRLHVQLDEGRWPGQERVLDFESFRATLRERIYVDTSGFFGYATPLRAALDELPPSQILLATDTPYEARSTEELKRYVSSVDDVVDPTDAPAVLGGNARRLLG